MIEEVSPLTCIHIKIRLLTFESPKPIKARLTLTVDVSLSYIKASSTFFCEIVACIGNPGGEVMKKLDRSKFIELLGQEWIYLTVGEAVGACKYMLHT